MRKRNKYNARKTSCNQLHWHDSKKEAERCNELHLIKQAGEIEKLQIQPEIEILHEFIYQGRKIRGITYRPDFTYYDKKKKCFIIEDTKGYRTGIYNLKKKMLLNKIKDSNIEFIET
ncbi:MAG: DUF1064 domain-containing protein [Candidatus Paceibacterota bacterium]